MAIIVSRVTLGLLLLVATPMFGDVFDIQNRLIEIYEKNSSSIVRVKGVYKDRAKGEEEPKTQIRIGTGFFISGEGHVLTNASQVHDADRIWVEHNEIQIDAEIIGEDFRTNVAILKIEKLPENTDFLQLDDIPHLPKIGTMVTSIACTFEFEPAPSGPGLIKGHESHFGQRIFPTTLLRTSIEVSPGESGSPLLDFNGRVVGMIVASLPQVRSSCVLPIRALKRIRDDILNFGKVEYSWYGIKADSQVDLKGGQRVVIDEITEGSPASKVEIKKGDVLLQVGDFKINRIRDVHNASFFTRPDQVIGIKVKRGEEILEFSVKVVAQPNLPKAKPEKSKVIQKSTPEAAAEEKEINKAPVEVKKK